MNLAIGIIPPKTPAEIRAEVIALINNPNFVDLAGSPQNQFIDEAVACILYAQTAPVDVLSGLNPAFASPWQLAQIGLTMNIPKKEANFATVNVTFTGALGTYISKGTQVSNTDGSFVVETTQAFTIGSAPIEIGCINPKSSTVTSIPIGFINKLIQPQTGVTSVSNLTQGVVDNPAETDIDYQHRLFGFYRQSKIGIIDQAVSTIKSVKNVVSRLVKIIPNSTGEINIVVGGGNNVDVASAIYSSCVGLATFNIQKSSTNLNPIEIVNLVNGGTTTVVKYVVAFQQNLTISVKYRIDKTVSDATFESIVSTTIVNYINSLSVGSSLNTQSLSALVSAELLNTKTLTPDEILALEFTFEINGVPLTPSFAGSNVYLIDFDIYFNITSSNISFATI